jgi:two-component system phosphate regulon sensor histidine kinase PhoR
VTSRTGTFQARFFLAALASAVIALVVAGSLFAAVMRSQINQEIGATLVAQVRLAADLVTHVSPSLTESELDAEADHLGALTGTRVTLIAPDGRVVGDSSETLEGVAAMENHALRPEVVEARRTGLGRAERHSDTLNIDMLYVAVAVQHPAIGYVRVALPLTDVRHHLQTVLTTTATGLGLAFVGAALIAWLFSARIGQRVRGIADVARRYQSGDLTPTRMDFGDDELGVVARSLDEAVQDVGRRLAEQARDRGRMEAILAGMVEGVIVVDRQGRLQLANNAAQRMLKLEDVGTGRPYIETIRHPAIAELVAAALVGRTPEPLQLSPPRDPSRTIIARAAPAIGDAAHGVVLVMHDITDLRRADQIRRDFVANVSHELRTPLTAIRGYVEALGEEDANPEDTRRFVAIIMRHTERMERLVKDLLRLARLDAGQETLAVVDCETRTLAQGVATDAAPAIAERHQHVEIDIAPGAEIIRGDPARLHDALRNLVANAITYGPEGTTVRIEALRADGHVTISVLDEGPGIPEED